MPLAQVYIRKAAPRDRQEGPGQGLQPRVRPGASLATAALVLPVDSGWGEDPGVLVPARRPCGRPLGCLGRDGSWLERARRGQTAEQGGPCSHGLWAGQALSFASRHC